MSSLYIGLTSKKTLNTHFYVFLFQPAFPLDLFVRNFKIVLKFYTFVKLHKRNLINLDYNKNVGTRINI